MKSHPMAGRQVTLKVRGKDVDHLNGQVMIVEDWWENVARCSWKDSNTPAAFAYAIRVARTDLPRDEQVVFGRIGMWDHLVHNSELGEEVK